MLLAGSPAKGSEASPIGVLTVLSTLAMTAAALMFLARQAQVRITELFLMTISKA